MRYASRDLGSFAVPLNELAAVGEYTTDNGPLVDDWFLVFVRKDSADWLEASMYAEGTAEFLEQLSVTLGIAIETRLAASTDFTSRVIWPESIACRPLFDFRPVAATNFLHRLKLAIIPEITLQLSADVRSTVRQSP